MLEEHISLCLNMSMYRLLQLHPTMMLSSNIVSHVFQLVFSFICVYIIRVVYHNLSVRYSFRHILGPAPASVIWGDEWELYHSAPGSLYAKWHKDFGKVVKFSGAFGVSHTAFLFPQNAIS